MGSCAYVSLIQYLSYYDSFYNDSIIPESYERNQGSSDSLEHATNISPGVLRENYPASVDSLYDYIQANKGNDYQLYLMDIINDGLHNVPSNYSPSTGMWNYHHIISTIPAFSDTYFMYFSYTTFGENIEPNDPTVASVFEREIRYELDMGNPLILHICNYDPIEKRKNNYHSVVAYYYDDEGIHANFGWGPDSTDIIIGNNCDITEIGKVYFERVEEIHSNNYLVNNASYCGCGHHTSHSFTLQYLPNNSTKHKAYCDFGQYSVKPHVVLQESIYTFRGHRYGRCLHCNASVDLGTGGGITPGINGVDQKTSENGSYITANGILIIVNDDLEAYLSGTLVFSNNEKTI